ncbi:DUF4174 domain-containing protein [Roseicitreum antarcticum]|uniref:DUF4174 domain-containing protein n=1 Tax=Roseicitreum antarcticum TaxID=564137 RepID=A0A1H2VW51_9RHOB|nr:DUF4174 domain-containing protein [Roseicitreum antarcticum]SDW72451.1 protein of unknown function [Roseicitreum antarcticum]
MKSFLTLALAALLPCAVWATDTAVQTPADPMAEAAVEDASDELLIVDAADVVPDDMLWDKRLLVIFANTPNDPMFRQQISLLETRAEDLHERDVVVALDTDPATMSALRTRLRPRGFMLAIIGKDGEIKHRKPSPWDTREILQAIDKFPLRRQEMLDRRPAGR